MVKQIEKRIWERVFKSCKSLAGTTVIATVVIALLATLDRGGYVLVNTIVTGGMTALVAMGLALTLGVLNIPMFAHGEYFMIGTLVAYYVFTPINEFISTHPQSALVFWGPLITIVAAMAVGAVAGVVSEVLVFRQLRKRSRENWVMNSFLLTVGLSVVMINAHQVFFGADFKGITQYWSGRPMMIMDVFISRDRVMAFVLAAVVVGAFWFFMTYTRTGRAIRAVSQDETGALIVGIGLNGILLLTMSLSCALAAIAGAGLLFMYPSYPAVGLEPLYMAWFVVILSGLGNVLGMVAIYIVCKWVTRTRMGVAFKAIGQNMEAARTSGINPVFYRVSNFVLSCALAGVLGGFYAHYYGILTPDMMHTSKTVEVLAVAYIGGRGSLWGGAAIAFPFIFAMELIRSSLSNLPGLNLLLYGLLLILVMIYYPGGFAAFFDTYIRKPQNKMMNYFLNGKNATAH